MTFAAVATNCASIFFCSDLVEDWALKDMILGAFVAEHFIYISKWIIQHYIDDVPEDVKSRRLTELIDAFQMSASIRNNLLEVSVECIADGCIGLDWVNVLVVRLSSFLRPICCVEGAGKDIEKLLRGL